MVTDGNVTLFLQGVPRQVKCLDVGMNVTLAPIRQWVNLDDFALMCIDDTYILTAA